MGCQEALELMSADLDDHNGQQGEQGEEKPTNIEPRAKLRQHLAACEECRRQQVDLGLVHRRLRAAPASRAVAPPALRARIQEQCARGCASASVSAPASRPVARRRPRTAWSMALTGAAAALFALLAFGTGRSPLPEHAGPGSPGSSLGVGSPGAPAVQAGLTECRVAISGNSPVAQACQSGGREGAMRAMERLTELARSRGLDLQCATCHLDQRGFQLTPGARARFASLLAATRT